MRSGRPWTVTGGAVRSAGDVMPLQPMVPSSARPMTMIDVFITGSLSRASGERAAKHKIVGISKQMWYDR